MSGRDVKRMFLHPSMIGRLEQCRYTSTAEQSCIRSCLHRTKTTEFLTLVTCAGPATAPHWRREEEMSLTVRLANGEVCVGDLEVERSTTQDARRESVHGVDVLGAEEGRMMCVDA
jgi:hypothetical protein